jgi:RHS repeat-associated protein
MVEKGLSGTYTQFVYRPSGVMLAVYSGSLSKGTIPLPGGSTAIYNASGLSRIRHKDWLGSSRFATSWAHTVYSKEAYAPFGETYYEASTPDRSFTGQDQDLVTGSGGTGVYDYLFRKYDPSAGRWMSPDPYGWNAVNGTDPQSLNRYAYVENQPMNAIDPSGLQLCAMVSSDGQLWGYDSGNNPCSNGYVPYDVLQSVTASSDGGSGIIDASNANPNCPEGYICISIPSGPNGSFGVVQPGGAANNGTKQQIQNRVSNFYNSKLGAAVQFGSPISLLPGWNPGWGNNLQEWGIAIIGKLGGLFGSGAVPGTTQLTTLSGTTTVGSGVELATEGTLAAVEKVATPVMGAATLADIGAHSACAQATDPAAWNYAFSNTMF